MGGRWSGRGDCRFGLAELSQWEKRAIVLWGEFKSEEYSTPRPSMLRRCWDIPVPWPGCIRRLKLGVGSYVLGV